MDKKFLEFWGNSMLSAAKSQEQFEKMAAWAQQGFKGLEEMTNFFLKAYGLDGCAEGSPDYVTGWKKAEEEFKRSINDYMNLCGFVPKSDYLELVKKYEEIKEKLSSQEETVKHLRMLASESKMAGQGELSKQFADPKALKKSAPAKEAKQAQGD